MKCPVCQKEITFWEWFKYEYKCKNCLKKSKKEWNKEVKKANRLDKIQEKKNYEGSGEKRKYYNEKFAWRLYIYRLGIIGSLFVSWIFFIYKMNTEWLTLKEVWKNPKNYEFKGFIEYLWFIWGFIVLIRIIYGLIVVIINLLLF